LHLELLLLVMLRGPTAHTFRSLLDVETTGGTKSFYLSSASYFRSRWSTTVRSTIELPMDLPFWELR